MSRALEHDLQNSCLELKQTELTLGLPGSQSRPALISVSLFGKELQHCDHTSNANTNNGCSLGSLKSPTSGAKRVFSDTINWTFPACSEADSERNGSNTQYACEAATAKEETVQERKSQLSAVNEHGGSPAPKAQVVGWPPIRSFRKNTMVSNLAKNNDDAENDPSECLYVKVSMEGAPYLRKIDLKTYRNYVELSLALEKMFSSFSYGKEGLCKSRLSNLLDGSEYVLTYEDKDGDWMLVGDVPWEMFTDSCRRLKIVKGSEAAGLDESCNPPSV